MMLTQFLPTSVPMKLKMKLMRFIAGEILQHMNITEWLIRHVIGSTQWFI